MSLRSKKTEGGDARVQDARDVAGEEGAAREAAGVVESRAPNEAEPNEVMHVFAEGVVVRADGERLGEGEQHEAAERVHEVGAEEETKELAHVIVEGVVLKVDGERLEKGEERETEEVHEE